MSQIRTVTLLVLVAFTASSCTAGIATAQVVNADRSVRELRDRGALQTAPYEYTMARRHADKAIEESGDAQYRTAVDLSKLALQWAEATRIVMEGGTRDMGGLDPEAELRDDLLIDREEDPLQRGNPLADPLPEPEDEDEDDFFEDPDDEPAPWEGGDE